MDIHETYLRAGFGPAMAKFIALVSYEGPFPADYAARPAPDPAMFGLPIEDDGSRNDPLVGQNMISASHFVPDFDALRGGVDADRPRRRGGVVERDDRSRGAALAERLGTAPVVFPGGHGGFLGGETTRAGPDAFATTLRRVLGGRG